MLSLTFNVLLAEAGYVDPAPPVPGPPHYVLAGVGGHAVYGASGLRPEATDGLISILLAFNWV